MKQILNTLYSTGFIFPSFFVLFAWCFAGSMHSQNQFPKNDAAKIDSLIHLQNTSSNPTVKLRAKCDIGKLEENKRISFWDSIYLEAVKLKDASVVANAIGNKALILNAKGNQMKAIQLFKRGLIISDSLHDIISISAFLDNLAGAYNSVGDIASALKYYHQNLKLNEAAGNQAKVAIALNGIGILQMETGNTLSALEYQKKSMNIWLKLNLKPDLGNAYNNLGYINKMLYGPDSAIQYYLKSLKIREEINDVRGMANSYNNIGSIYRDKNELESAREYYQKSLQLCLSIGEKRGCVAALGNLAKLLLKEKKAQQAIPLLEQAMSLSREINSPEPIRNTAKLQFEAFETLNKHKEALEKYELYILLRDSVSNETTKKSAIRSQLKYEYEKQAAADSVAHAKESEIKNVELAKQKAEISAKKNQQYVLFGGLGLVIVFAGFMYNRFKVTQKQKEIIESQKEIVENQKSLVEEKQKEILDSIHYAKRIQLALLPSEKQVNKNLERLKKV